MLPESNNSHNNMTRLINTWANFVINKRFYLIVASVVLLLVILVSGPSIPFDNSTERYFVLGDPALTDYHRSIELFGDNEYLIIGFEAAPATADIFQAETLRNIAQISEFLEFHEYITQVRSLTTFQYIHADGDDLRTDYLIDDIEDLIARPNAIAAVKSTLEREELALDTLISRDFRHTRIAARVEYHQETAENKVQLVQDLQNFVDEHNLDDSSDYIFHLSGYPLVQERIETIADEDTSKLIAIMVVLMLVILFASFRSFVAMAIPWLVIVSSLLIVLEVQSYLEIPHTIIDRSALLPTLIIIGIGLVVHVLVEFFNFAKSGKNGVAAARATIIQLWRPAFFTAITTSAGFYALSVTRVLPIKEFALLGAIGPIALFFFSLTVLPAMLSYINKVPSATVQVLEMGFISRITSKVPDFTLKNRHIILLFAIATTVFSVWYLPRFEIDSNYTSLFKAGSQVPQDIEYFDEVYRGMMNLDVILDSGEIDGVKQPEFLRQADQLQTWLEQRSTLGPINSLVDYLKEISQAVNGDVAQYYRIPETSDMTAQFLLLYESAGADEDLSDIKDFDNRFTRLVIPVVNMRASEMAVELDLISTYLNQNFGQLQPAITGTMALYTVRDAYISEGMVLSFIVALSVIAVFFIVLFKSFKYGILSLIPSVLPIILAGSIAAWLGIYLDHSAVIVFAMTLGIAVDDAIHVMSRYLLAKKSNASTKQALQRAMNESGRAVLFSSIVLVFGFSVLCFGSLTTVIYVGFFGGVIMTFALIGDLIFLPAILYLVDGVDDVDGLGGKDGVGDSSVEVAEVT